MPQAFIHSKSHTDIQSGTWQALSVTTSRPSLSHLICGQYAHVCFAHLHEYVCVGWVGGGGQDCVIFVILILTAWSGDAGCLLTSAICLEILLLLTLSFTLNLCDVCNAWVILSAFYSFSLDVYAHACICAHVCVLLKINVRVWQLVVMLVWTIWASLWLQLCFLFNHFNVYLLDFY